MLPLVLTDHTAMLILNWGYFIWLVPEVIYTVSRRIKMSSRANERLFESSSQVITGDGCLSGKLADTRGNLGDYLLASHFDFWTRYHADGRRRSFPLVFDPCAWKILQREPCCPTRSNRDEGGPYRWICHPSYTGSLITMLGLGLAFTNWLCLVSVPLITLIGYSYRANVEERMLTTALGDRYREYMKDTKRFIPFVY